MKRLALNILLIFLMLSVTGCENPVKNREEIDKVTYIKVVGVDRLEEGKGNIRLTVSIPISEKSSGGKQTSKKEVAFSSEGKTIFEAVRNMHAFSPKKIFWGQIEFILIGQDTAKNDILQYLDFFTRDHEIRLNTHVIIVKDTTAEEVIKATTSESFGVSEKLSSISKNVGGLSMSSEIKLYDLISTFDNEYSSACIPYLKLIELKLKESESTNKKDVQINGYAIFRQDSLARYIEREEARGLNWVINKIQSGIILVDDKEGSKVSLEIINSKSKIIPSFADDKLSVLIKMGMSSNIGEIESKEDVFKESYLDFLKQQQEQIVEKEVQNIVRIAQSEGLDFLGIGNAVYHKHPKRWKRIENDWNEIFSKIKIDVEVSSKINRAYVVKQPTRYRKEGE